MATDLARQYLTATVLSGTIFQTTTATNSAASTNTKVTYGGGQVGIRPVNPNVTNGTAGTIPAQGAAPRGQGWRTAQIEAEGIGYEVGQTWAAAMFVASSSSLTLEITCIAYLDGEEVARGTSVGAAITTGQQRAITMTTVAQVSATQVPRLTFEFYVEATGLNLNVLGTTTVTISTGATNSYVDPGIYFVNYSRTGSDSQDTITDVATRISADFRRATEAQEVQIDSATKQTSFARLGFEYVDPIQETPLPSATFRRTSAPQVVEYVAETAIRLSVNFRRATTFIDMLDAQAIRGTVNFRRSTDAIEQMLDVALKQITYGRAVRYSSSAGDTDPLTDPTRFITGVIRNCDGTPYNGNALVILFRDDDVKVAQTVSNGLGEYSFARNSFDTSTYYVAAFIQGAQPRQSVTERGLVPV